MEWLEEHRLGATVFFARSSGLDMTIEALRRETRIEQVNIFTRAIRSAAPHRLAAADVGVMAVGLVSLLETGAACWLTQDAVFRGLGRAPVPRRGRRLGRADHLPGDVGLYPGGRRCGRMTSCDRARSRCARLPRPNQSRSRGMTSTRPFRFGLQAFTVSSGKEWLDIARRAEDLGYCTLFTTDHYFGPGDISDSTGHRPVDVAPIAAMMAAAGVTTDLRVGCRVFAVDYHNPNVLAKELATIDFLTEGRLEVGLGAGWVAAEYDGLGIPMDRPGVRIDRLAETVELVRRALDR